MATMSRGTSPRASASNASIRRRWCEAGRCPAGSSTYSHQAVSEVRTRWRRANSTTASSGVIENNHRACISLLTCPRYADILHLSAREWSQPDRGMTQMAQKFDPTQTPFLVTWLGRGYDGFGKTDSFATLQEALAAYNGKRPHNSVC